MKTKTTTVRIPKEKLDEIDRLCKNGTCRNTWINEAIDFVLNGSSDFHFGLPDEEEPESPKPEEKPRYKVILDADMPKAQVTKVSYDGGKTWIDVPEIKNPKNF